jgi:hypothetical protein
MQFRSNRTRCPSRRNHGTPGGARLDRLRRGVPGHCDPPPIEAGDACIAVGSYTCALSKT